MHIVMAQHHDQQDVHLTAIAAAFLYTGMAPLQTPNPIHG